MSIMTGQVILRHVGDAPTKDGRKLFAVIGIIAVPDYCPVKAEHQYTVSGTVAGDVRIHFETGEDRTEMTQGDSPSGMLKRPIWRC